MAYEVKRVYLGRDDDVYKEEGVFEPSADLSSVKLIDKANPSYYFFIDSNVIEQMDIEGNRITSNLDYTLKRVE